MYREGDPPRCGLVVRGLLRFYLSAPDGREVTLRYLVPGNLPGAALAFLEAPMAIAVQALTDATGLLLNIGKLRELIRTDARVARALATEVARSQEQMVRSFGVSAFGSVRQRVARHLLDVAAAHLNPGLPAVVPISQQALADAVGSAREVVARALHDLRDLGLVDTTRGGIVIRDAAHLHAATEGIGDA